jgi:hypothetical protein
MTRAPGRAAEDDPQLAALLDARTEVITLVGKSWGYHVDEALRTSREENLAMVADSIRHLRAQGRRVMFDAEHFFDGWARDRDYAREVVRRAAEAGAEASCCATPTVVRCRGTSPRSSTRWCASSVSTSACTSTTTAAARSRTRCSGSRSAPPGAGHRERHRRALRQREPVHAAR